MTDGNGSRAGLGPRATLAGGNPCGMTGLLAFVFAGQGVDPPWVDAGILAEPATAALVAVASEATGVDVARALARGGRELARTEVLQPAMVAVGLGVVELLARAGVRPSIVAGHSLGEVAAWAASGAISAADAVAAAAVRGRLMAREAARRPGGLVRLHDADDALCARALQHGAAAGAISIAAHNAPDQWVLAGDDAALDRVVGAFRSTRLAVAGAWHSPAMADAVEEVDLAFAAIPRRRGVPLVANRTGAIAPPDAVPGLLAGQLVHRIEWVATQRTLAAAGATRWIACGHGSTLRAMARRTLGDAVVVDVVDRRADVDRVARELA